MISPEAVGYAAGTLTTIAFIPQAWLSWKTRHTAGLSLGMYAIFALGVVLWLTYGLLIGAWPVIVSNLITLGLALFILGIRLRHGGGSRSRHG
jgi:MtN3 and saliva related transmembrane protein